MKKGLVIALLVGVAFVWVSRTIVCPLDIITGKERVLASANTADGGKVEIIQYWNGGDFYNLDLRHTTPDQVLYECVIDPDCNRLAGCKLKIDAQSGESTVWNGKEKLASYSWRTKELTRKGVRLIKASASKSGDRSR